MKRTIRKIMSMVLCIAVLASFAVMGDLFARPETDPANYSFKDGVLIIDGGTADEPYNIKLGKDSTFTGRTDIKTVIVGEHTYITGDLLDNPPSLTTLIFLNKGSTHFCNCPSLKNVIACASLNVNATHVHENDGTHYFLSQYKTKNPWAPGTYDLDNVICLDPFWNDVETMTANIEKAAAIIKDAIPAGHDAWKLIPVQLGGTAVPTGIARHDLDITASHRVSGWAKETVQNASEVWLSSYTVEQLPDYTQPITRGQFCTLVYAMTELADVGYGLKANYSNDDHNPRIRAQYLDYDEATVTKETVDNVSILTNVGIVNGLDGDSTILPDLDNKPRQAHFGYSNPITREQAATILYRAYNYLKEEADNPPKWQLIHPPRLVPLDTTPVTYADTISDWATEAVSAMTNAGVMGGYPNGAFGAKDGLTVEQAIIMCYRLAYATPKGKLHIDGVSQWNDFMAMRGEVELLPTEDGADAAAQATPAPTETPAETNDTLTIKCGLFGNCIDYIISKDGKTLTADTWSKVNSIVTYQTYTFTVQPDGTVKQDPDGKVWNRVICLKQNMMTNGAVVTVWDSADYAPAN